MFMKWAIDKIEQDIVLLENIETGKKKEVSTLLLPVSINEGNILIEENNTYRVNLSLEEKRRQEILERFNRLRNKDKALFLNFFTKDNL